MRQIGYTIYYQLLRLLSNFYLRFLNLSMLYLFYMEDLPKIESNNVNSLESLVGKYPVLAEYLESSKKFYEQNQIPLSSAEYNQEKKELAMEMTIPEFAQAWKGFAHGGYLATLLDTCAGVAGFMETIKLGKGIVTKEIGNITYKLPIQVGSLVKVRGFIISIDENIINVEGTISLVIEGKERKPFVSSIAKMVIKDIN